MASSTKLASTGAGGPVDTSGYPGTSSAAVKQPFWDLEAYDANNMMLGQYGALFSPNPWDVVKINGNILPGSWTATATPSLQLDVQKPNGYDGAALVEKGFVPAGITLIGKIWTAPQWSAFQDLIPTFWRWPNKWAVNDVKKATSQIVGEQLAVTITHPGLAALQVGQMVVYQMTPPEDTGEPGMKQIKLLARQYIPPPQKRKGAVKKVQGTGSQDRTVQASIIKNPGPQLGTFANQLKQPDAATSPLPPSLTQGGPKQLRPPNFLGH